MTHTFPPAPTTLVPKGAGKPRASITKPQRRSRGFETVDQRLPESPPLHNPAGRSFMDVVRERTRSALRALFGRPCRVLNAECNAALFDTVPGATPACAAARPPQSAPSADQVVPGADAQDNSTCACGAQLWREGGVRPEHMLRTAEELMSRIMLLYARCVDTEEGTVDYSALLHSDDFKLYLASARKLRYFDPTLLSHDERKAFFLNVYNALMIHAIAVLSRPTSNFERIQLYNTAAYSIGGRVYSLNAIEHGVLRGNRAGGGPFAPAPFEPDDARLQCALPKLDPRIHFALNCGARSCPPVRYYDAQHVDGALDAATRSFLLDVVVDSKRKVVVLSRIFNWYRNDFSDSGNLFELCMWLLPYLPDDTRAAMQILVEEHETDARVPKVEFADYDWTVNDSSL